MFDITNEYASGESALWHLHSKGKETRQDNDASRDSKSNNNNKRKAYNFVIAIGQSSEPLSPFKKGLKKPSLEQILDGPCLLHKGNHKARECFSLRSFTTAGLKVAPVLKSKDRPNEKKDN